MTPEKRAKAQEYSRQHWLKVKARESPSEKAERLRYAALVARMKREEETPEEREARLAKSRARYHRLKAENRESYQRIKAEDPERHKLMLAKRRARRHRMKTEEPERYESMLAKRRASHHRRKGKRASDSV
jgi:hypothetical protein